LTIDFYPAAPEVGLNSSQDEIVDCEVEEFNEFRRSQHEGDDSNWFWLDDVVNHILRNNADVHEDALEEAASNQEF
tara:strand:+ start:1604 stop:1831 length:228 start_codon:yes stop_codon:yes gene_type:complete